MTDSSEQQRNIDAVKRGYQAFAESDIDTMMDLVDGDLEWIQPGQSTVSGTYRGKDGFRDLITRLAEKQPTITSSRYIADGDTVVVTNETTIGGETTSGVMVATLRDGKLLRVENFGDTAVQERIYGRSRAASASTNS